MLVGFGRQGWPSMRLPAATSRGETNDERKRMAVWLIFLVGAHEPGDVGTVQTGHFDVEQEQVGAKVMCAPATAR